MAGRRYDTEELQRIATLRDRDFSIQAVAREVGRTPSGIQSALRARGWCDVRLDAIVLRIEGVRQRQPGPARVPGGGRISPGVDAR